MKYLIVILLVGCSSPEPDVSAPFEFTGTFSWSQSRAPDVVAVEVDGAPVESDTPHRVVDPYASYDVALAEYVTKHISITTTNGVLRGEIGLGECWNEPTGRLGTIVREQTHLTLFSPDGVSRFVAFYVSCVDVHGDTVSWGY